MFKGKFKKKKERKKDKPPPNKKETKKYILLQFILIHTVKRFGIVNKAELDVFLELSCFFHDPTDIGNLMSGSSASSKTSLNIREFMVQVLLKSGLENFEHYFTSM